MDRQSHPVPCSNIFSSSIKVAGVDGRLCWVRCRPSRRRHLPSLCTSSHLMLRWKTLASWRNKKWIDSRDASASPPATMATLVSPAATCRAAWSHNKTGWLPPWLPQTRWSWEALIPIFEAIAPARSLYGHVHGGTTATLSTMGTMSRSCTPESRIEARMASRISSNGSRASSMLFELFLASPTPTRIGVVRGTVILMVREVTTFKLLDVY